MDVKANVWSDYEVRWAYDGTMELARYVGADVAPHAFDQQPELKLSKDRNGVCHLVSVIDENGQLRLWPLWWHHPAAWHGPALLKRLAGRRVRRLTLRKIPEGGVHIDVRRK